MLESAGRGVASLRFYGWTKATLSLGYFQSAVEARAEARLAALPWVRRPSGGAALVHHYEVTYALALPAGAPWQQRGLSWLSRMHAIVRDALANLGAITALCSPEAERKLGPVLCFLHHTRDDLLFEGHKVAGSAQRKHRGALLQHGSVLLATSAVTPELPGIAELSGLRLNGEQVSAAVAHQFTQATGWPVVPGPWTDNERRQIEELTSIRYSATAWNDKR